MNWLRRHVAEISVLALVLAIGSLSLGLVKTWPAAEWWNVGATVMLAASTLLLTCVAFRALHTWKAPEVRKVAICLFESTNHLEHVARSTCWRCDTAAGIATGRLVSATLSIASLGSGSGTDDLIDRISDQRSNLSEAKSKWEVNIAYATDFLGEKEDEAINKFRNLVEDLVGKMVALEKYLHGLRTGVDKPTNQGTSEYEELEKQLQSASSQVKEYLQEYFRL